MTVPEVRQHPERLEWVGKSIPRVEDPKFLRGRGNYIDDYEVPNMLEVAVARSTMAHAKILSIDTSAAEAVPGVVAVVTSENVTDHVNPMPDFGPSPDKHTWYCLAVDKVRYMGEGVAVVAATSRAVAEDAAELIEVTYEPLEPLTDMLEALEEDAPLIHEALGSNVPFHRKFTFGDVDGDFAAADVIVRDTLHWGRSGGQPLETVGAVADYDAATGMMTIHVNSMSFTHFLFLLANTLRVPSNKLDLQPHPSGGSFGAKFFEVKTATIAAMMARITGRPVKFMQDRLDNIANGDHHGSDRYYEVELAAKADGTLLSTRYKVVDNYGAYIQFGVGQHGNSLAQAVGPYRMSSIGYDLTAVLTNKCQQGAYRGFGSEVGNWILERMVDLMARELDMDPVDIRRMNFIQPDQFPYFIPTGNVYDSGDYEAVLNKTMELSDYKGWRKRQAEMRAEGRHVGIGVCTCQERSVFSATEFWFWFDEPVAAPVTSAPESVTLKVDAMGAVTATLYSNASWGNSPETMVAQFVAEELGVKPEDVSVVYAGSNQGMPATGPGGSRFTIMVSGAVEGASQSIRAKAAKIAAHLLEANEDDLVWEEGGFAVRGSPDQRKELAEIALAAHMFKHSLPEEIETGLEASHVQDHPYTTMPNPERTNLGVFYPFVGHASHVVVVEVDPETGRVEFLDYAAVHDCGTVVNPRSVGGQVIGGTVQGLGSTLYEEFLYDEDGVLRTPSFAEYLIPSAMDSPTLRVGHNETPSPYTPYGIKGGGEAGRMMAPSAICAAIDDALGIRIRRLPATPERIVEMVDEANG